MNKTIGLGLGAMAATTLASQLAGAVPVYVNKEKDIAINAGVIVQPWMQITKAGEENKGFLATAPDGKSPAVDFYLRRARLLLYGNISKDLSFFVDTDQPNMGKNGDFGVPMFIQDAWVTYKVDPAFQIDMGMFLIPLSHATLESAAALNTIDYHIDVIKFNTSKVFRDTGIQFRGLLLDDKIHYRVAVMEGVRGTPAAAPGVTPGPAAGLNEKGLPRFAGQLRFNILGAEKDFLFKGMYFAKEPIISVGVGADYQGKSIRKGTPPEVGDYLGVSGDVFVDYPLSEDQELLVKANVFNYSEGTPGMAKGGIALYGEAGFRYQSIEPVVWVDMVNGKDDSVKLTGAHVGANFWIDKFTYNVKADAAYITRESPAATGGKDTKKDIVVTVQTSVFF